MKKVLNVLLPWSTVSQKEIGEIGELELSKCVNLLLPQSIVLWWDNLKLTKSAFLWDNLDQDQ